MKRGEPVKIVDQYFVSLNHPFPIVTKTGRPLHVGSDELADEASPNKSVNWIDECATQCSSAAWNPHDVPHASTLVVEWNEADNSIACGPTKCCGDQHEISAPIRDAHCDIWSRNQSGQSVHPRGPRDLEFRAQSPSVGCRSVNDRLVRQRAVMSAAKMLQIEAICSDKIPRRINNEFKRSCGEESICRNVFEKRKSESRFRPVEEKHVFTARFRREASLSRESWNLLRNRYAVTAAILCIFPTVQRAGNTTLADNTICEISLHVCAAPGEDRRSAVTSAKCYE